jgi:hypothetical protein
MSNRKLQEFDEYVYGPRSVLRPGDRFRASRGPYYQHEDGTKTLMAERGLFTFRRYCEKGASKWVEAQRVHGGVVNLWVGKAVPNPELPSFRRRPYKFRKVTERKQPGNKKGVGRPAKSAKAPGRGGARAKVGVKPGGAKPRAKAGPRPKANAGSTSAKAGVGIKRGENGVEGGTGRGKGLPSTSGSTSI